MPSYLYISLTIHLTCPYPNLSTIDRQVVLPLVFTDLIIISKLTGRSYVEFCFPKSIPYVKVCSQIVFLMWNPYLSCQHVL